MSEMVERVARALCGELLPSDEGVEWIPSPGMMDAARAAIQAMREPTNEMATEGRAQVSLATVRGIAEIWRVMIDEALK